MGQITLTGKAPVDIILRRSARARRLSLRVSQLDGRVTLTVPSGVSEREARRFAAEKSDWIFRALGKLGESVDVAPGVEIPVEGVPRRIAAGSGRSARLLPGTIMAPESRTGPAVAALLKHMARERLGEAVERYSGTVGRPFGRLTLRDTRSRWGSCSAEGNLMFSWRLVLAPREVLDYVAAHEVAHLAHMDHSARFWGLVGDICPHYAAPRAWLRREGHGLHRFRF